MSAMDMSFAVCAVAAALVLLLLSPWQRAVVKECLLHPLSDGWVDVEDGRIKMHRGMSLSDHVLNQTLASLVDAQKALEGVSRELQARPANTVSQPTQTNWLSYSTIAAIAAAAGAAGAAATRYLGQSGNNPSNNGGGA
jgi:hypothetical protein